MNIAAAKMLWALLRRFGPTNPIVGRDDSLYMDRLPLLTLPDGGRVRLHRIVRSDLDLELHSHPFEATSLILSGSYHEERRVGEPGAYRVETRLLREGDVNQLTADTFHRIDLDCEVWSLFVTGPKLAGWSFWDRETGDVTPHQDFASWRVRHLDGA